MKDENKDCNHLKKLIEDNQLLKERILKRKEETKLIFSILKPKRLNQLTFEELNTICKECNEFGVTLNNYDKEFFLNVQKESDLLLLKELSKIKMPLIKSYMLFYYSQECDTLNSFLVNSIPSNQDTIRIICYKITHSNLLSNFLCLREAASKVTNFLFLMRFKFSGSEFSSIVSTACKVKAIKFENCVIKTDYKFDFGKMKNCCIKELSLWDCAGKIYCNWYKNKNRLVNIFNAISRNSNFRSILKKIDLRCSHKTSVINLEDFNLKSRFPKLKYIEILT